MFFHGNLITTYSAVKCVFIAKTCAVCFKEPPTSTVTPSSKVKSPHRGLRGYKTALRELLKAVTLTPMPERLVSDHPY